MPRKWNVNLSQIKDRNGAGHKYDYYIIHHDIGTQHLMPPVLVDSVSPVVVKG